MSDAIEERRVELGEVGLHVTLAGPAEGRAVLLLHGFPDSALLWRHQIPVLAAAGYRVVAPDLRGFGRSDRPEEVSAYSLRHLLGDVEGLLTELGIERAAVVGHDWGSALSWATAMFLPHRVERLCAISVGHGAAMAAAGLEQRAKSWYMLWFLEPGAAERVLPADDWAWFRAWGWGGAGDEHPEVRRQVGDLSRPGALTAGLNWYRANIRPSSYVLLPEEIADAQHVSCPVLGLWSTGDFALSEAQMTRSERFVDGPWRYERLEGAGHWVPTDAPDRLNDLLLKFLG